MNIKTLWVNYEAFITLRNKVWDEKMYCSKVLSFDLWMSQAKD